MPSSLIAGQRRSLPDLLTNQPLCAALEFDLPGLTAGLIGLDDQRQTCPFSIVTERQPVGLDGALRATFSSGRVEFEVDLDRMPPSVHRLMFVVGHDALPISQAKELRWTLNSEGLSFNPLSSLHQERTVILVKIYRHVMGWRLAALGQGYDGGWNELLQRHGAAESTLKLFAPLSLATPEQPVVSGVLIRAGHAEPQKAPPTAPEPQALEVRGSQPHSLSASESPSTSGLTWEVQDSHGTTLLALREAQSLDLRDGKRLALSEAQRTDLGVAVQGAVRMAAGLAPTLLNANTFHLSLGSAARQALAQGGTFLQTGSKHGGGIVGAIRDPHTGRLMATGSFKPNHLARVANVATIAFQIAAVVTAQYYLHNINQQLKTIDRKLDGLQEFLEAQAAGRLIARLKGISRNIRLLESRSLDPEERTAALGDVLGLIREAESQMAQHELPMANLEAVFKKKDQFKLDDAKLSLEKHKKHMNTALFAAWANIQALQLGVHLGWAEDRVTLHQDDLVRSLDTLERATDVFEKGLSRFDAEARARNAPILAEDVIANGLIFGLLGLVTSLVVQRKRKVHNQKREEFKTDPQGQGWMSILALHRQMLTGLRNGVEELQLDRVEIERQRKAPLALVVQTDSSGAVIHAFMQEEPVMA